jgi:PhoPQ-activated pathogenicity-related protein
MLTLLAFLAASAPRELDAYLRRPDPSYRYTTSPGKNGIVNLDLTSGTWQGAEWHHQVLFLSPQKLAAKGTGILYITGDGPTNGDMTTLSLVTASTGMPVAMLFKIPNQPIFGLREDDLIAYTFQKYLETGDATWPLLFPMTRAAIRAMDAVQDATKNSSNPINKFVVCGASKRGWTTWLVGASGDKRVVGIAPMVLDNLNLTAQMPHQLATWGQYSPQIQDYTKRGLQAKLATPRGKKLGAMIDPYSYRDRIRMPALIIRGSNDPYWTADALDQYEPGLKMRHWLLDVPNAGHDLKGGFMAAQAIGAFARSLAGGTPLPKLNWSFRRGVNPREVTVQVQSKGLAAHELKIWVATSDSLDFRPSEYKVLADESTKPDGEAALRRSMVTIRFLLPEGKNCAVFAENDYRVEGREFSLSSPTKIYQK